MGFSFFSVNDCMPPRRPYDPKKVDRLVQGISLTSSLQRSGKGSYVRRVLESGVRQVVALEKLGRARGELGRKGVTVHQKHIRESMSFSPDGQRMLIEAARIVDSTIAGGIPIILTCKRGYHRTGRTLYLVHRLQGATHEEAMAHSGAPWENARALDELWRAREKF